MRIVVAEDLVCPLEWREEAWAEQAGPSKLPAGASFVVDEAMEPVPIVLRWLVASIRDENVALTTEIARANDLYEWLLYCQAVNRPLLDADADDAKLYRDRLLSVPSPRTGQPLEPSTVRRRMSSIVSFYEWVAGLAGNLSSSNIPSCKRRVRVSRGDKRHLLAHLGSHVKVTNDLLPKVQKTLPEFINSTRIREVLRELGADPLKPDGRPCRDWLIAYLAFCTGMRRAEIAALTVHQISALKPTEEEPARLKLVVTKGGKHRSVPIETFMQERLLAYIHGERANVVAKAKAAGKFRHRAPIALFLNGPHCPTRYLGNQISPVMIDRGFANAQKRLVGNGARNVFHHLRHSHVLWRRVEAGDDWDSISRDLGHAQVATTIDIYGRALGRMEPEARARYLAALKTLGEEP